VRRAALAAALLLLATLIQVTLVNNLPWPGAAGPDLVLVTVVALALTGGPMEGMLGGFCAGLALDVAPPATHLIGQYALVFCLVGYGCGRVGSHLSESVWAPIGVVAIGSAAGELLFALTGMLFGDLNVTWSAVGHVLPASVLYDVLLSPFVLYAVIRARALAAPAVDAQGLASFPGGSASQRVVPGLAGAAALFSGSGAVLRDSGPDRPRG
jgi:rod shape-determining protein MreD